MKSAPFDYVRATSVDEVCRLLAGHAGDARIIAGGQSLVPVMANRLARPDLLIDINAIDSIKAIARDGDVLRIGAGARQGAVERAAATAAVPLLVRALAHVGHQQTRNRGTVGGSLCQADPAAELPLIAVVLNATLTAKGPKRAREIAARDFLLGPNESALTDTECLTDTLWPIWPEPRQGAAVEEVAMRHGDFAMVAAAAQVALHADGRCMRIAVGLGGVGPCPRALPDVEAALVGTALDETSIAAALAGIGATLDPDSDMHASAAYRRRVAPRLLARAIRAAAREAGEAGGS